MSITTPAEVFASDGLPLAAQTFLSEPAPHQRRAARGRTPVHLVFAHATGFCGAVWRPVQAELNEFDSTTFDFRGHGASRSARDRRSWWEMAGDVLAVAAHAARVSDLESDRPVRLIGVGHSMGGASLLMAELLAPGTFEAFVLVEPIVFGPPFGRDPSHPLVNLALRRRDTSDSRAAVRSSYAAKPPFSTWHSTALDGYIDGGFVDVQGGVALACRPKSEAEVFTAAGAHAAWERLAEIDVATTILYGADTDTYPPGHGEAIAAHIAGAECLPVEGTGHFLPMEKPAVVAEAARRRIDLLS